MMRELLNDHNHFRDDHRKITLKYINMQVYAVLCAQTLQKDTGSKNSPTGDTMSASPG